MSSSRTPSLGPGRTSSPKPTQPTASTSASPQPASPTIPGRDSPDLPLTMSASTVLMKLPRDASAALATAGAMPQEKVVIRFKPVGSAPVIRKGLVTVDSTYKFDFVVTFLRKQLQVRETDSVFLYVNNTFAPALDEVIGNLWRCFKDSSKQLNIAYSMTPAFG